jgi:hypothetical protein
MNIKNRLILIEEGSKFFDFIENMIANGKRSGRAKLKDGTKVNFRYVTCVVKDNKKIHYISI